MVDSIQITSLGFSLFFFFFPSFIRRGPLVLPSPVPVSPLLDPSWWIFIFSFYPTLVFIVVFLLPSSLAALLSPIPSSFLSFSFTFSLFTFYICILTHVCRCLDSTINGHCYILYIALIIPWPSPWLFQNSCVIWSYKIAVFFSSYQHKECRDANI